MSYLRRSAPHYAQVDEGADVADLISLTHLHEPSILYTLRERYANGAIYTYTGPILLAVNPFYRIKVRVPSAASPPPLR